MSPQRDPTPSDEEDRRRVMRSRNLAVALGLGLLVVLFFAITIVRIKP